MTRENELLERYCELLRGWAPRLDLVAGSDLDRLWERHIEDSLRALPLVRSLPPGPLVDVGSGAGLPGIPLAICSPDRVVRLLEPRAKRAGFLEEAVRALELNCEVVAMEATAAARDSRFARAHVLATARAVAPPTRTIELGRVLIRDDGVVAVWHGPTAEIPHIAERWAPGIAIFRGMASSPHSSSNKRK